MKQRLLNILIALDQLAYVLVTLGAGHPDETLSAAAWRTEQGLPHARGGVSRAALPVGGVEASSPRTWGCFQPSDTAPVPVAVFPTHVGVFPKMAASGWHP